MARNTLVPDKLFAIFDLLFCRILKLGDRL